MLEWPVGGVDDGLIQIDQQHEFSRIQQIHLVCLADFFGQLQKINKTKRLL